MLSAKEIQRRAEALAPWLQAQYRALHRCPETAHHETRTNAYIRAQLDLLGIPYFAPAHNITVAVVEGSAPGRCVGLRCDTDALPVQEETGLPFASENLGVMHACGHDAHIAFGLGAARLLKESAAEWQGRVKVIFQPAEEGENGADEVIATGLADDVDAFFGLHVWSPNPTGTLRASPITVAAAVDMFTVTITGQGGHGATPEKCRDAVVAGAAVVNALQTVVSRGTAPLTPALLTIGSFHAGTVGNIIARQAVLRGTLRALDDATAKSLREMLERIACGVAAAYGCEAEIAYGCRQCAVVNDPRLTALAQQCAGELVPPEKLGDQQPAMLGDDFAQYGRIAPGCYAHVGIADEALQTCAAHHSGKFRVDERVLPLGAAWMALFAIRAARADFE